MKLVTVCRVINLLTLLASCHADQLVAAQLALQDEKASCQARAAQVEELAEQVGVFEGLLLGKSGL